MAQASGAALRYDGTDLLDDCRRRLVGGLALVALYAGLVGSPKVEAVTSLRRIAAATFEPPRLGVGVGTGVEISEFR